MQTIKDSVLTTLKEYKGKRALTRRELASLTHSTDREIREAVAKLRKDGRPICVQAGGGYYLGTKKEYERSVIADYNSRIADMANTVRAFYGMPIEGQVNIDVLRQ